jgi:hypothetical protein
MRYNMVLPLSSAAAGLFLVIFAGRLAISEAILLPVMQPIRELRGGNSVDPAYLSQIIRYENMSLAVFDSPMNWGDLGFAYTLQSTLPLSSPTEQKREPQELQRLAQDALFNSLKLAPANPAIWTRLTFVSSQGARPLDAVLAFWRLAHVTGPNEPQLRLLRFQLGLSLWPNMNTEDKEWLFDDVYRAFYLQSQEVAQLARDPFVRAIVRSALLRDLPELKRFEGELAYAQKQAPLTLP